MEIPSQAPRTAVRCIVAGLVALSATACAAPDTDPTSALPATGSGGPAADAVPVRTDPSVQTMPEDPITVIGDALEAQVRIILIAVHPDPTR